MREFIKNNHLSFGEGRRNSTVTVLVGYAQHLSLTKQELKDELEKEIEADTFIRDEIDRLWDYCERNLYANFWSTDQAKKQYKF